jgi:hypothetical protein
MLSPFNYKVEMHSLDEILVKTWKEEIDKMIEQTTCDFNENPEQPPFLPLGENPTKTDIILFCIARFVAGKINARTNPNCFPARAAWKFIRGGSYHISDLVNNKEFYTCLDASIVTMILAKAYGIDGNVVKPRTIPHFYWQQSKDKRAIIDAYWLEANPSTRGYLNMPKMYDTYSAY